MLLTVAFDSGQNRSIKFQNTADRKSGRKSSVNGGAHCNQKLHMIWWSTRKIGIILQYNVTDRRHYCDITTPCVASRGKTFEIIHRFRPVMVPD